MKDDEASGRVVVGDEERKKRKGEQRDLKWAKGGRKQC